MAEKSVKCSACGKVLTAESEDEMVAELQEHAHDHHDMDMSDEQAKEAVKRGHT